MTQDRERPAETASRTVLSRRDLLRVAGAVGAAGALAAALGVALGRPLRLREALAADAPPFPVARLVIESESGQHGFDVEVAATSAARMQGLQHRTSLAADAGMLFLFEAPGRAAMWMKDTYIPLDILFIADSGRIVAIAENTRPMSLQAIRAPEPVTAVLELNAGTAKEMGIAVGDRVLHPGLQAPPSR